MIFLGNNMATTIKGAKEEANHRIWYIVQYIVKLQNYEWV